jgi:hypothetical protein
MSPQPPPKRRRGAPPGNTNALKYTGLYSAHAKAQQIEAFEKLSPDHLQGQIDGLQIFLDRFVRTASAGPVSREQAREDLIAYTNASKHKAYLIRQSVFIQSLSRPLQDADDWLAKLLGDEEDTPPPAPSPV